MPATESRSRLPLRGRGGAAVALLVLAAGGCGWADDDPAPQQDPSAQASTTPQPLPGEAAPGTATAFNVPGATSFDDPGVAEVLLAEDALLTRTEDRIRVRSLPELETVHQLTATDGLFTDLRLDEDGQRAYAVQSHGVRGEGSRVGEASYVVTLFDVRTGEVEGTATAVLPQDSRGTGEAGAATIQGIVGDVVVLEIQEVTATSDRRTALAVDLDRGALLWSERPAVVLGLGDGVVLTRGVSSGRAGEVTARDLRSGEARWGALPATRRVSMVGGGEAGLVLVRKEARRPAELVTLDPQTGAVTGTRRTEDWEWHCRPASEPITVCSLADGSVVGWDLDEGAPAWELPDPDRFAPAITAVHDDLAFGHLSNGAAVVIDALTGEEVEGAAGAAPSTVNAWGGAEVYLETAVLYPRFDAGEDADEEPAED